MGLFTFFRSEPEVTNSAVQARERLQVIIAHERSCSVKPDYLPQLQHDILEVIKRYVDISEDKLDVKFDSEGELSTLEVNIELPS